MKRALGYLAAVVLAVALPACGNSGGKTNEAKKAAGLVPKDALAYVSVAVNPSDSQKSDIDGILSKFPKASKKTFDGLKEDLLSKAVQKLGLNYQQDVKPWLGDELGIAVLPNTPEPSPLGLIKSKDDAKAKAALDKAAKSPDFDAAYRIVNGYVAVVQKKQAALLDTVARQTSSTARHQPLPKFLLSHPRTPFAFSDACFAREEGRAGKTKSERIGSNANTRKAQLLSRASMRFLCASVSLW